MQREAESPQAGLKPNRRLRYLAPVYGAALAWKNWRYDLGRRQQDRLRWPVVSVGNLSVGGAGKTPFVEMLVRLFAERGWNVDVLTRGYGRSGSGAEMVDGVGPDAAERFGDEAVLLANSTGARVYVCASRHKAGLLAEETSRTTEKGVHLLDDGFQHRQLSRTLDIVLVQRRDLEDSLLPGGRLREPLSSLRRADFVMIREEERDLGNSIMRITGKAAWVMCRRTEVEQRAGLVFAFCGLAQPEQFFSGLRATGMQVVHAVAFPDHHRYTAGDIEAMVKRAIELGASGFVTTAKDKVKLTPEMLEMLEDRRPLAVARVKTWLRDEGRFMDAVTSCIADRTADRFSVADR